MPKDQNNNYETAYYNAEEVRRQSAGGPPKKKKKKSKRATQRTALYLACVILGSCLLAGVGWLLFNDLCSLNKDYVKVKITVDEGDSVGDVAKKLKDAGLINYRGFFKFCGIFFHASKNIDPGEYELNSDMDYRSLILNMHDYEADKVNEDGWIKVVIPEGKTVNEIIDILTEAGISTREELEDACANFEFQSYSFLKEDMLGKVNRMEGFLFPTTQAFDPEKTAVYDIDTMLTNFVSQFDDDMMADINASGHSLYDIVTMASIIEKEGIGDETERKNIASVLYNRLETTDRETYGYLQLDTTIYYALSLEGKDKTAFDKDLDSPYNTYKYPGLPAGPICCPGMDSIKAAIYPNDTEYYYFAAGKDGVNHFFKTYNEHLAFINSDMYQPD